MKQPKFVTDTEVLLVFSKMFEGTDTKACRYFFLYVVLFGVQVSV